MLRPSRDWRESITLSSRDPHFGQRIVSEHSLAHNKLWRQRPRMIFVHFASDEGTRLSPQSCALGSRRCYAAAAFGALIFFLGLGFFSSNSNPTLPFSNFR